MGMTCHQQLDQPIAPARRALTKLSAPLLKRMRGHLGLHRFKQRATRFTEIKVALDLLRQCLIELPHHKLGAQLTNAGTGDSRINRVHWRTKPPIGKPTHPDRRDDSSADTPGSNKELAALAHTFLTGEFCQLAGRARNPFLSLWG